MKRTIAFLLLIPSLCFGAFTEFYCDQTNGNNMNGGSNDGAVKYTSVHGNWVSSTRTFTPTDSSNPSSSCAVGDFAQVYVDGATTPVCLGRLSTVTNATNGTLIIDATAIAGSLANQTGTATITVGGRWKGPNGTTGFPFAIAANAVTQGIHNLQDASGDRVRVNMKNNANFAMTADSFANGWDSTGYTIQGYTSTAGDGGKATFDGGTSGASYTLFTVGSGTVRTQLVDLIFNHNGSTGSSNSVIDSGTGTSFVRCVFANSKGTGVTGVSFIECEAYGNNSSNTGGKGGIQVNAGGNAINCYSHDNTGSNSAGFYTSGATNGTFVNCISDTNGGVGFLVTTTTDVVFVNCDAYNNGSDGFKNSGGSPTLVMNSNVVKNTGAGINISTSVQACGFLYNLGYGSGTQANGSADTIYNFKQSGTVTYPSNITPWNAPTTGDFSLVSTNTHVGYNAGRGHWEENDGTNTGTVGYPDIGAAQHNDSCSGTGPCLTSSGTAY